MKRFIVVSEEKEKHFFNKCQGWPETLSKFLILACCVFEFDTPALEEQLL